jgi:hypothetical protein
MARSLCLRILKENADSRGLDPLLVNCFCGDAVSLINGPKGEAIRAHSR